MIRVLSLSITRVEILIIGIHKIYSFCGPFLAFISDFRCLGLVASWLLTFRGCEAIVPYIGDMMNPDISLVMGNNRLGLARPAGRNWGWIGGHPFVPSSTWHPGIGARIDHGWMGKVYIYIIIILKTENIWQSQSILWISKLKLDVESPVF